MENTVMSPQQDQQIAQNKRRKLPLLIVAILSAVILGVIVAVLFVTYGRNADKQYRMAQEKTSSIIAICADTVTSEDGDINVIVKKASKNKKH